MNSIDQSVRLTGIALVALGIFGCSASLTSPQNGNVGGPGGSGGLIGVGTDGGPSGGPDARTKDAALVCLVPPSTECFRTSNGPMCELTWAEVLATLPLCRLFSTGQTGITESRGSCGDYDIDAFLYVDSPSMSSTFVSYYDKSTGHLVAQYEEGCLDGPPDGIAPCSWVDVINLCPQDGGADGAHRDATAADAPGSLG